MRILDLRQLVRRQVTAPVFVGDEAPVSDAVAGVVRLHQVRLADPVRPPAQVDHPVLDRADGQPLALPLAYQGLHMLAPEPCRPQAPVAEVVERVGHLRERERASLPGAVGALGALVLEPLQVVVELPHGARSGRAARRAHRGRRDDRWRFRTAALLGIDIATPGVAARALPPWSES